MKERWHFVLDAARRGTDASESDRMNAYKVAIALATSLHEVGLTDPELTELAVDGMHELNDAVWLGEDFLRRTDDMIALLRSSPAPLARKPTTRESITFTRGGDLLAIRLRRCWVVGYVHVVDGPNAHPHIELYERTFARRRRGSRLAARRRGRVGPACALVTLRNDERVNLALTVKVDLVPAGGPDGMLMPAAWYFDGLDEATETRIAEIVRAAVS